MPRFYFDLSDGSHERDEIGSELDGLQEAEHEAIRFLGEVLKHEPERLAHGSLRVDVSNEARAKVRTIHALIEED